MLCSESHLIYLIMVFRTSLRGNLINGRLTDWTSLLQQQIYRRQQQRIEGNIIIIFATETARFSRVPATSIYRWDGGRFENMEKESRLVIRGHWWRQDVRALIGGHLMRQNLPLILSNLRRRWSLSIDPSSDGPEHCLLRCSTLLHTHRHTYSTSIKG